MARIINRPEPGFFKMRLVKGGPWVPALVYRPCPLEMHPETFQWIDRVYHLEAEIDGMAANVDRIWTSGQRITAAEYLYMKADRVWVRQYAPHLPEARPEETMDINKLPPIF